MSDLQPNQHYVSQVLLRRFADNSGQLQRFCLKVNKWKARSPSSVFSWDGYNQLLVDGTPHNAVDESLKKQEDEMPKAFGALDALASGDDSQLNDRVYDLLFAYCAHLWCLSPFCKAVAPVNYLIQLHSDLNSGRTKLLELAGIEKREYPAIFDWHSKGGKFVFRGEGYLQTLLWINFRDKYPREFELLRHYVDWSLCRSPIEMPLSDVAFLQFHDEALKGGVSLLPVSPSLVLVGKQLHGFKPQRKTGPRIAFGTLTQNEAEYYRNVICLSGITAIACNTRQYDIPAIRQQATARGIRFAKIKNVDEVLAAGTRECRGMMLWPTTEEEYKNYVHSRGIEWAK